MKPPTAPAGCGGTAARRCVAALCLALAACATDPGAVDDDAGRNPASAHRTEFSRPDSLGVVSIPAVDARLQQTLRRLLEGSGVPADQRATAGNVRIAIAARPALQGWVADRTIYIPWRLLPFLESDEVLAALVAHEASHLLLGHATLDAKASAFGVLSAFGPLLLAGTPLAAVGAIVGGQYGDRALAAGWAREQELAADAQGARLLAGAGLRPTVMVELLDTLDSLVVQGPSRRPDMVQTRTLPDGRSQYLLNLGSLRFGSKEDSHPDFDQRRDQMRALLAPPGLPVATPAAANAPPPPALSWKALLQTEEVQSALQGLQSADMALRAAAGAPLPPGTTAAQWAQQALRSPIGNSFIAYWAGASVLSGAQQQAAGMSPFVQRMRQSDTPIIAPMALLAWSSQRNDWATAADTADALRERFEPDRGLYKVMATAYNRRALQIAAFVNANMNRLGGSEALSLNLERMKRDLQSAKMLAVCMSMARSPNDHAQTNCKD